MKFKLSSKFNPSGDQPQAIEKLSHSIECGNKEQVLLGVTGSGKTFTMANIIQNIQKPTLVMAHNKTLAAQLYSEFMEFFPENAVEYFVSYYDYYQPEAYIPANDTYIEKDSQINERIDRLRHSATRALLERKDVIVVASVSCIYGLGSPELYLQMSFSISKGEKLDRQSIIRKLVEIQYKRNDMAFERGTFRARGDVLDIFPSHMQSVAWRVTFFGNEVEAISEFDPLTGEKFNKLDKITIYANSHYVTPRPTLEQAFGLIKEECEMRVEFLRTRGKLVEAQRLEQRTMFDIEMMMQTGTCKGIENYSRFLSGRSTGQPPPTLFEYLGKDALLMIDESHVTLPQIGGMYNGDRARKTNLVEYGFRLPSALDNRPLKFEEWDGMRPQTLYVSATPGVLETKLAGNNIARQIIRPTGLLDPIYDIRPAESQVDDLINECKCVAEKGQRVLVTTLTKKMSENLNDYLNEIGVKSVYLHSDITTLDRIQIIQELRQGVYDVLVGVNLLREGLDIPECALVAILDADKEGFLRSETSLIQTIGRAARNAEGRVILYADVITNSIKNAVEKTKQRRKMQQEYNAKYGITPKTIQKNITQIIDPKILEHKETVDEIERDLKQLRKEMVDAAQNLEFEKAAKLRDMIQKLEQKGMLSATSYSI